MTQWKKLGGKEISTLSLQGVRRVVVKVAGLGDNFVRLIVGAAECLNIADGDAPPELPRPCAFRGEQIDGERFQNFVRGAGINLEKRSHGAHLVLIVAKPNGLGSVTARDRTGLWVHQQRRPAFQLAVVEGIFWVAH